MRINNDNVPSISVGGPDQGKRADRADLDKNARTDKIELSSIGLSAATTHADKLEHLRLSIANGSYRPTADEVAGSMIDEMLR